MALSPSSFTARLASLHDSSTSLKGTIAVPMSWSGYSCWAADVALLKALQRANWIAGSRGRSSGEPNVLAKMPSGMSTCISKPVSGSSFTLSDACPCPMGPEFFEAIVPCDISGKPPPVRCPAADALKPPLRALGSAKTAASRRIMSNVSSGYPGSRSRTLPKLLCGRK